MPTPPFFLVNTRDRVLAVQAPNIIKKNKRKKTTTGKERREEEKRYVR